MNCIHGIALNETCVECGIIRKLSDADRATTVTWIHSPAMPQGLAIIVSAGVVVWIGPANLIPEEMRWPSPITINVDADCYRIVAAKAAGIEQGTKIQ